MPRVSKAHREARREEIIAAAIRAFAAKGISRTSMADIIAESGLSVGAIYGHFEGKHELVAAAANQILTRRRHEIDKALEQGPLPTPGEALGLLLRAMLNEAIPPHALVQAWAEGTVDPDMRTIARDALVTIRGAFERALRAWFDAHPEDAPEGVDAAVRRLLPIMTSLGQGFILQYTIFDDFDTEAYLETIRDLLPH